MRVAFVTNFCPHYRGKTFETLARYHDVDYCFFSAGDEWYWQQEHGLRAGDFRYQYLPGYRIGHTRVTPTLPWKLWRGNHDLYIKCINGRFALPATYAVARLRRKPFILWTGLWMRLQTPLHRLFFPLTRFIYRHADAIVVYGEHVKRYLVGEGVPAERVFVAAHAVDNDAYTRPVSQHETDSLREKLEIKSRKVVLFLGRLEAVKGLNYLLEAFAALRSDDAVLVLAGTGSKKAQLRSLAQQMGMADRVRFAGYAQPEDTPLYYALAWVLVLPSVTTSTSKETWGLVVNEAMNQGVPVIATDAVGASAGGLVRDGVNGLVVPERDSAALAQALQRILDDRALRDRMGQNARRIVAEWDNERMVQGFREAIDFAWGLREESTLR